MALRLSGKRILITGATANIGHEAVRLFIEEGARVVIGDIDEENGRRVAAGFGEAVTFIHTDVTSEASVARFVDAGVRWLGGLDVLVQNAGLQHSGRLVDFDEEKWNALFAVNARAHFFGAKHAIPHFLKAGEGSIINTSSLAGRRGGAGLVAYSATKGAVIAFTTALSVELAPDRIRVNAICPGWVDTDFNNPAIGFMGGAEAQRRAISAMVPLGRQARVGEIGPLFVYLASDESSYMTGQSLVIDGGVYNA